jgi:hypothetical protein
MGAMLATPEITRETAPWTRLAAWLPRWRNVPL